MNPVPNLIKDTEGNRLCVFTHFAFGDYGPAVYFYDFIVNKEIAKASGAQLFLAYQNAQDLVQEKLNDFPPMSPMESQDM